jgi:hypothetical protein
MSRDRRVSAKEIEVETAEMKNEDVVVLFGSDEDGLDKKLAYWRHSTF